LAQATLCSMGTQLPPEKKDTPPNFWPTSIAAKTAGWMKMPLGTEVDLSSDGLRRALSSPRKGHSSPPLFGPCLLWPQLPTSATAELLLKEISSKPYNSATYRTPANSYVQTSLTDTQTNKQTKIQRFWPPRRWVKSEPHQTFHGDRRPRACSCISKTFRVLQNFYGLTYSFAATGHRKFLGNLSPRLKTSITL